MNHWLIRATLMLATVTAMAVTATGANVKKAPTPREPDTAFLLAPLNEAVNLNAGTLEARFALDYSFSDYLRPELSSCIPFRFLQILTKDAVPQEEIENGPSFSIHMHQKRGGNSILFGTAFYYRESKSDPTLLSFSTGISGNQETGPWLKQGEWHTLAATWEIDKTGVLQLELFLDGKSYQRRAFPKKASKVPSFGKTDLMGIGGLGLSPAALLSYRLSNRVRTKEEITSDKPLVADEATTFFLDAATVTQYKPVAYRAFAKMRKENNVNIKGKGVLIGNYKIVATPQGKAIQFYEKSSR
jgi:hypothetical protein